MLRNKTLQKESEQIQAITLTKHHSSDGQNNQKQIYEITKEDNKYQFISLSGLNVDDSTFKLMCKLMR
jgi:hypothetical protein